MIDKGLASPDTYLDPPVVSRDLYLSSNFLRSTGFNARSPAQARGLILILESRSATISLPMVTRLGSSFDINTRRRIASTPSSSKSLGRRPRIFGMALSGSTLQVSLIWVM